MKPSNTYVIFHEKKDEFLHAEKKVEGNNLLGWCAKPTSAKKYFSVREAEDTASRIANNKGYHLIVCELHESASQIGIEPVLNISPMA